MSSLVTKYTDPLRRDALEAFNLARSMRNVLFFLLLLSLLILGSVFWLTDITRWQQTSHPVTVAPETIDIPVPDNTPSDAPSAALPDKPAAEADIAAADSSAETPAAVADDTVTDKNTAANDDAARNTQWRQQLARVLATVGRFSAFFAGLMYLLTLLLMIKFTIVGRLGGAAAMTRAFFLMLLAAVLMVPWKSLAAINYPGALFPYDELLAVQCGLQTAGDAFCYYLHYVGLWAGVLLLIIAAHCRSRQGVLMVKRLQTPAPAPTAACPRPKPQPVEDTPIPLEPSFPQKENPS